MKEIYAVQKNQSEDSGSDKGGPAKQKTVAQQFKVQLDSLIAMIVTTDPHCLRPNDAAKPKLLTRKRLTKQMRYGGVLEAVRVARMEYPVRLDHAGFFKRYQMPLPSVSESVLPWSMDDHNDPQTLCVKFMDALLAEGAKPVNYTNEDGSMSRANKIRNGPETAGAHGLPEVGRQLGLSKVCMRKGGPQTSWRAIGYFIRTPRSAAMVTARQVEEPSGISSERLGHPDSELDERPSLRSRKK